MIHAQLKFAFLFILQFLVACHSELDIEVPNPSDKIVIDGTIELDQKARVYVTSNSPYFSNYDEDVLRKLILTGSKVELTTNTDKEILTLRKDNNMFPPYFFESEDIKGAESTEYSINVSYGGKEAWATTRIPKVVKIDTLLFNLNVEIDSLYSLYIGFTDPELVNNYYRIFTKRVNKDLKFIPTLTIAIDGRLFDGQYIELPVYRGAENFHVANENNYFKYGDTVQVKLCTMDEQSFLFWNYFQSEVINSSNPFATSLKDEASNIEGDGLGILSGYAVDIKQVVIQ